jgi:hypothetical protein
MRKQLRQLATEWFYSLKVYKSDWYNSRHTQQGMAELYFSKEPLRLKGEEIEKIYIEEMIGKNNFVMEDEIPIGSKMDKFLDAIDDVCYNFGFEIWPTPIPNVKDSNGKAPMIYIHGDDGKGNQIVTGIWYVDGDGRGK